MGMIKKRFQCFSMALDEKRGIVYSGGSKGHVFTFPEQTDVAELSYVRQCSPYLSPECTYVMFFNDPCYMYLYETENVGKYIYRGKFEPASNKTACWKSDDCFLFAVDGTVNCISIDKETKSANLHTLIDLREYTGNPKLRVESIDCFENKLLLYCQRLWSGGIDSIIEIDESGNMLERELGTELNGYDDVRYDKKGGVFFSKSYKNIAWCKNVSHVEKADQIIENTHSVCLRVSSDGKYIAVGTWNGAERGAVIIETNTFSVKRKFKYSIGNWGLPTFSSDSHYVLIGGKGAQIIDVKDLEND